MNDFVELSKLYLDPNNYRLINESEYIPVSEDKIKDKDTVARTYRLILGKNNENIQELIDSFKTNGFIPVDQIQVKELSEGSYLVIEGNRRIATLKYLFNEYEQKSIDLGKLDKNIFSKVPVVIYKNDDSVQHLTLMALKHISGTKKWGEWNQAKLLEELKEKSKIDDEEICKKIGIDKTTFRRNLRALGLTKQYQESDYGDQFKNAKFPIFMEAIRSTTIKNWLKWNDNSNQAENEINRDLFFSLVSNEQNEDNSDILEPAISKRDDVRLFSKILEDKTAMELLEKYRDLNKAYNASELIFKEKIKDAIDNIDKDVSILRQLSINSEQIPKLEIAFGNLLGIIERAKSNSLKGVEQSDIFYSKIDEHFSSIEINNYKVLKNVKVNKISRINLIAGLNNSGKTSFLESIYLLCKQNDFNGLLEIFGRRYKVAEDRIVSNWFSEQINDNIIIKGTFDKKNANLEIRPFKEENKSIDKTNYLKSVEISTNFGEQIQESVTRIYQNKRETSADSIKSLCNIVLSSPFFFNESRHYTSFYYKSIQSKLLPRILDFIKNKFIHTIKDVRLVDEFQRFVVTDDYFSNGAMDLTSYGEGLQRIFFTSLIFASAENGIVLIDEFENAIHVELIENYSDFIYSLSKEFNVQVFLTSHSKECIDAFIKNVPVENQNDFSFYAFVRNEEKEVSVREFNGEKYFKLLEAGDVDLRQAR